MEVVRVKASKGRSQVTCCKLFDRENQVAILKAFKIVWAYPYAAHFSLSLRLNLHHISPNESQSRLESC